MKVRCSLNGAKTNIFTDNKIYDIIRIEGQKALVILDDNNNERVVLADQVSPHLNIYWTDGDYPYHHQKAVGIFETVLENKQQ